MPPRGDAAASCDRDALGQHRTSTWAHHQRGRPNFQSPFRRGSDPTDGTWSEWSLAVCCAKVVTFFSVLEAVAVLVGDPSTIQRAETRVPDDHPTPHALQRGARLCLPLASQSHLIHAALHDAAGGRAGAATPAPACECSVDASAHLHGRARDFMPSRRGQCTAPAFRRSTSNRSQASQAEGLSVAAAAPGRASSAAGGAAGGEPGGRPAILA